MVESNKHDKENESRPGENPVEERNPFITDKFARISRTAIDHLGYPGRMLYLSKSMKKPTTIFNANVYDSSAEKIWYGELEVKKDRKALVELSAKVGTVYILWERDGRFLKQAPTLEYVKSRAISHGRKREHLV